MEINEKNSIVYCKFCLREASKIGGLRQSHIIPRFVLLMSKDKKNGKSVIYTKKLAKPILSQFDWKEPLLCSECESKMKVYEDYLKKLLFSRKMPSLLWENEKEQVLTADNDKFAQAFLSIFWRSVVSSLPAFTWAVVPEYFAEVMRRYLLAYDARSWERLCSFKIEKLYDDEKRPIKFLKSPFVRGIDGLFEYVYVFGGYCVTFQIPANSNIESSRKYFLHPRSKILRIKKFIMTMCQN